MLCLIIALYSTSGCHASMDWFNERERRHMNIQDKIKKQLEEDRVVLYMKGTPAFPQCGFSGKAAYMLQRCGASFKAVNVLEDPEIREGIKQFGNWPTIPQLYIDGELVGGCDIMAELFENGELQKMIGNS